MDNLTTTAQQNMQKQCWENFKEVTKDAFLGTILLLVTIGLYWFIAPIGPWRKLILGEIRVPISCILLSSVAIGSYLAWRTPTGRASEYWMKLHLKFEALTVAAAITTLCAAWANSEWKIVGGLVCLLSVMIGMLFLPCLANRNAKISKRVDWLLALILLLVMFGYYARYALPKVTG